MIRKFALASAAVALSLAPIAAQAAPAPRAPAPVEQGDELGRRTGIGIYLIGAIVLGLIIWGVIELTSDDPSSP